jgi:hypothetical protein
MKDARPPGSGLRTAGRPTKSKRRGHRREPRLVHSSRDCGGVDADGTSARLCECRSQFSRFGAERGHLNLEFADFVAMGARRAAASVEAFDWVRQSAGLVIVGSKGLAVKSGRRTRSVFCCLGFYTLNRLSGIGDKADVTPDADRLEVILN